MIHIFHMLHWFLIQSTAQAPFLGVVSPWLDRCEEIGFTASLKSPKWNGLMPGVHRWYWKIHWNKIFEKAHGDFQNLPGRSERNAEAMLGGCIVILNDQEYPETWTPGIILLHQLKNKFNDHSRKPTAYGVDFDTRKTRPENITISHLRCGSTVITKLSGQVAMVMVFISFGRNQDCPVGSMWFAMVL